MKWSFRILKLGAQVQETAGALRKVPKRNLLTYDRLEKKPLERFRVLPGIQEHCFLTYMWIDGTGENLRSKHKVSWVEPQNVEDLDKWHFDGSSTYQAIGHDSDMMLHPVAMCQDPFNPGRSKLVMCEVFDKAGNPAQTNHRSKCKKTMDEIKSHEPWFGFEQEYTLMGTDNRPLGFPEKGFPDPQGPYYCSVGAGTSCGREISQAHLLACSYAGIKISGKNAEVLLGQWEYQVGPCVGIDVSDQLWFSRYILYRVAEDFGVKVSLDPKPIEGDWNGTGNHCNFSTKETRDPNGGALDYMWKAIKKLEKFHDEHIKVYDPHGGADNMRRLTGKHETARIDQFTAAAGSRNVSIRIPRNVELQGYGWLEDRRPSANCDPYAVTERVMRSIFLEP